MAEKHDMIYLCGMDLKKGTPQEVIDYLRNNISSIGGKAGYCSKYLILPSKKYQPGGRNPFNLFIAYQEPREQSQGLPPYKPKPAPPPVQSDVPPTPSDDDCPY